VNSGLRPILPMTIHEEIAAARNRLRAAGLSSPEADLGSRVLAEFVLGWPTERLLADGHESAGAEFVRTYRQLVERRASREPLAYIVGIREFWGLAFEVSPAVLIPRPETEFIVEAALELFSDSRTPFAVADVCTGCGCIAVAVARERPLARVLATDVSAAAVDVARLNAARHHVGERMEFAVGDLLAPVGQVDAILANPPYVVSSARPALQPEVRDHEPDVALFGGVDGLHMIRRLVTTAPAHLREGGYLVFEFGYGQDPEVEALVAATDALELVELRRDLQGIARTAVVRRTQ
jgi:release factor glutamine methyltransferase